MLVFAVSLIIVWWDLILVNEYSLIRLLSRSSLLVLAARSFLLIVFFCFLVLTETMSEEEMLYNSDLLKKTAVNL